jgi:hypothetical protein
LIWNKEELPEEWKKSIIAPIYKHDKHSVLTAEAHQSANHVQTLTPYAEEITGDHQCGF